MSFDLIKLAKNTGFDEAYLVPGLDTQGASSFGLSNLTEILPEATSVLLLLKKHNPFKPFPPGTMTVQSHYPAHQSAYFLARELSDKLVRMGILSAPAGNLPLKTYASGAGLAPLKSSLMYHKEFGTYFVLQALAVEYDTQRLEIETEDLCGGCDLCVKACPTDAIRGDGAVDRRKCLRTHIPVKYFMPSKLRKLAETNLIGCGICQAVCPLNKHVKTIAPSKELTDVLSIEGLLDLKSDNNLIGKLQAIIGKNEARPARTIATACMAAGNLKDAKYTKYLENILSTYINPLARGYAARALGDIGGSDEYLKNALDKENNHSVIEEIQAAIK